MTCPSLSNLFLHGTSPLGGGPTPRHPAPSPARPSRGARRRRRGRITNPNRADWRRVNRARETDPAVVLSRVPAGSQRVAALDEAIPALEAVPAFDQLGPRRRQLMRRLMAALVATADVRSMTSRPGHARLEAMVGRKSSTVSAAIRWLREQGVLGLVAGGRSARYAAPGPDGKRINEAAVYVLCKTVALQVARLMRRSQSSGGAITDQQVRVRRFIDVALGVERSWTPTSLEDTPVVLEQTTHARERPQTELWPVHASVRTRRQQLAAARALQDRVLSLRVLSARDVRSLVRGFFEAGWTVADVLHGLEHAPAGAHHLDSLGVGQDTSRVRGHVRWRLGHWLEADGQVSTSISQRLQRRRQRDLLEQKAQREAAAHARTAAASPSSALRQAALKKIRADFARRRLERESRLARATPPPLN